MNRKCHKRETQPPTGHQKRNGGKKERQNKRDIRKKKQKKKTKKKKKTHKQTRLFWALTHLYREDFPTTITLADLFPIAMSLVGLVFCFFFVFFFLEIPRFNANSVDPDQTPCFAASDLGLDCLPF